MVKDILVIDDEADIRSLISGILEDEGYGCRQGASSRQALDAVKEKTPDLIILDIWLQSSDQDGIDLLKTFRRDVPFVPIIMISGHGTIETAVSAIKEGAYDFIEKPFKADRLLLMVQRAIEAASLRMENQALKEEIGGTLELVGQSVVMRAIQHSLEKIAISNSRVLITGEQGTGKNIASRLIHKLSRRKDGPYLTLNCAILRPDTLEAELFGVERGKRGALEMAHEGTLLLDEVADMPLETQGKIVRALQEQSFRRVGGDEKITVDVRIVATSNKDLLKAVQSGTFREDLYYRLNVVPVHMPPLREVGADIRLLINHFAMLYSRQNGQPAYAFSESAIAAMQSYGWPGNVRQLRNVIERAMILFGGASDQMIGIEHLLPEIAQSGPTIIPAYANDDYMDLPLKEAREAFEREYLNLQVSRFEGNISRTAKFVGMERSALHRKLKSLDISASDKQDTAEADTYETNRKKTA